MFRNGHSRLAALEAGETPALQHGIILEEAQTGTALQLVCSVHGPG
jgi:hypothetical protein